jgi:glucosamine--fructose-6-phosphate aminotransferase (isomerizing)
MSPYITDILAQPLALREAVNSFAPEKLFPIVDQLQDQAFDRVIISGMGSSLYAAYPAYLQLSNLGIPVLFLNSAELLHSLTKLITPQTLLWLNSQSGRSAELVNLLAAIETEPPARILTFVNDLASPMAQAADTCLPIYAGEESNVSTKTFLNMLAVNLLAAEFFLDKNLEPLNAGLLAAADEMQTYLSDWKRSFQELDILIGSLDNLTILGRGASMAAVWNGSLINKEAAKSAFEGMHAADFRHGPLELAGPEFNAMIFAGDPKTKRLNRNLALEIVGYGGQVFWVDQSPDPDLPTILIPNTSERTRPLLEILPLQMLTLVMAARKGFEAGKFRLIGKVTDRE